MNKVEEIISEAISNMISQVTVDKKIDGLIKKHDKKVHFIPKKYRVFGGILQSLNIQFGNFIEELMAVIISKEPRYEIIHKYSGKKNNKFLISMTNEKLIDDYITKCQTTNMDLEIDFPLLMSNIITDVDTNYITFTNDVDLLFKDIQTGTYYYLEIKYNDDHDTDKFMGINRKFIKTSAFLINELEIKEIDKFVPILFFFNEKKLKGNIYIPERQNIYRGKRFFDEFLTIDYNQLQSYMLNLSESKNTVEKFDNLYNKIMEYKEKN